MNFQKMLLIVIPAAILIICWQWFSRVDRTDAVQVGTAFTQAVRSGNMSKAATYYLPDAAAAFEETMNTMKSGATERMVERLPSDPDFTPAVTTPAGVTTIVSADKNFSLEMRQVEGKWYVAKAP